MGVIKLFLLGAVKVKIKIYT